MQNAKQISIARATAYRALDVVNRLAGALVAAALVVMVAIVFWQVVVRFVLPKLGLTVSAPWTEEIARYLMIWSIFLGLAIASRYRLLIAVNALLDAVPSSIGQQLRALAMLVTIAFLIALTWYGYRWAEFGADESSPVLSVSKYWLYLAMPIGSGLAALNLLALLVDQYAKNPLWAVADSAQATWKPTANTED